VIITSNRTREVHDALKRRCLFYWIDYPSLEKERQIVAAKVPGASEQLSHQVVGLVQELRKLDLYKLPGVAETLDWVTALVALDTQALTVGAARCTLIRRREDLPLFDAAFGFYWRVNSLDPSMLAMPVLKMPAKPRRLPRRKEESHVPPGRRENSIPLAKVFVVCYNTLMQRTIRIQLAPSLAQADALAETSRQFTAAFNQFVELGWQEDVSNATKLHFLAYYAVRDALPALNSNLTNTARAKAAEALRSAFTLRKDPKRTVTMPRSDACPPRYNVHTYRVDWESQTVRMSLVGGRQTIRFRVLDYAAKYAGYPVDTADLVERSGVWWLHVVVTVPAPSVQPTDQVVGVDLGINRPAVTSNNKFLGQRRWKAIEGRYFKLTRALQKKGTKSAKRHLRKAKQRRSRFRKDADHILSKQIVQAAETGSTIVLENLKDIRKRTRQGKRTPKQRLAKRQMHSWPFASLKAKIAYKAEERGCTVVAVDPRHTSQLCSCCGHTARNNRCSQSIFKCRQCGYHLNADLNAARNIAAKYRAGGGRTPAGGLRNQPGVSTSDSCGREAQAARF